MDGKRVRACIYVRVSTEAQELEGYSLEEQERLCRSAIESKEWEYVRTYTDGGFSGKTVDRPALQEMLKDIESGKIDAVLIYKLDRLSRSQKDTVMLIEDYFLKNEVDIVSLKETLDTSTPWGRAMIGILAAFNQLDRETIVMRTTMGRRAKAKTGGYTGGRPPIGYKVENKELVVDEREAWIVREIFKMRKRKMSYRAIADTLERRGILGRDKAPIQYTTVGSIINHRELYLGKKKYAGVETEGKHPAIITEND